MFELDQCTPDPFPPRYTSALERAFLQFLILEIQEVADKEMAERFLDTAKSVEFSYLLKEHNDV
jgi:hypothetical protein